MRFIAPTIAAALAFATAGNAAPAFPGEGMFRNVAAKVSGLIPKGGKTQEPQSEAITVHYLDRWNKPGSFTVKLDSDRTGEFKPQKTINQVTSITTAVTRNGQIQVTDSLKPNHYCLFTSSKKRPSEEDFRKAFDAQFAKTTNPFSVESKNPAQMIEAALKLGIHEAKKFGDAKNIFAVPGSTSLRIGYKVRVVFCRDASDLGLNVHGHSTENKAATVGLTSVASAGHTVAHAAEQKLQHGQATEAGHSPGDGVKKPSIFTKAGDAVNKALEESGQEKFSLEQFPRRTFNDYRDIMRGISHAFPIGGKDRKAKWEAKQAEKAARNVPENSKSGHV